MYKTEQEFAIQVARLAGAKVLHYYEHGAEVSYGESAEPVTEADIASNQIIIEAIQKRFPDDAILSEESRDSPARLKAERVWIIDPMDGTREFVDHVGQFAVMIGLAVAGEPVMGVVYQPTEDRLWYGSKGRGANLVEAGKRERTLAVSKRTIGAGLRFVMTRSHPFEGADAMMEALGVEEVLRVGSVGLKAGFIAAGDAEIYAHPSPWTKEWDSCAPHAILSEAGGRFTDMAGGELTYNKADVFNRRGLLASNGLLHDQAVEIVKNFPIK